MSKAFNARWIDNTDPEAMVMEPLGEDLAIDAGGFHAWMHVFSRITLFKPDD
ncbi:MAG: hypothetical protein AAF438_12865 [Pseudomonadota bacterium]